ncbi:unnamed protein product [Camellia sinensis]
MEKTCFPYLTALFFAQYSFLACFTMNVSSFTTDEYALLAFKAHITFDNPHHILANNWSADTSVCDWIGVSCGKRHHRVTALNLPDMGIGGTIPPHIGNLSFLSYFNITNNTFQGHLPVELARLHLLNVVDFNFNNFSGGVPTWFGNLPKLQYLCLASNSFTGLVPPSIGNISTLESLDLRDNFLEGGVPKEIGHLTKLKWLQMEFNNLSGSIPPTIFNISSLQWIEFRHNMLSGSLPEDLCVFLPKLEFLRLSLNEFDGQIPTTLGECRELQFLSLSANKFSDFIPKGIGNLTMLQFLYLGVNNFRDSDYGGGSDSSNNDDNSGCSWGGSDGGCDGGSSCGCNYGSESDNGSDGGDMVVVVVVLATLMVVVIVAAVVMVLFVVAVVVGEIPHELGSLRSLKLLALFLNKLTGNIPKEIGNCSLLSEVYLDFNNLTDQLPRSAVIHKTEPEGLGSQQFAGADDWGMDSEFGGENETGGTTELEGLPPPPAGVSASWLSWAVILHEKAGNDTATMEVLSSKASCYKEIREYKKAVADCTKDDMSAILAVKLRKRMGFRMWMKLHLMGMHVEGKICYQMVRDANEAGKSGFGSCLSLGHSPGKTDKIHMKGPGGRGEVEIAVSRVVGSIPEEFGKLPKMETLYLQNNNLMGSIPSTIFNISTLQEVALLQNQLSGKLPSSTGVSLPNLKKLFLGENELSGIVPDSISNASKLVKLGLSDNKFNGSIPSLLGNLRLLEYLDLQGNNFTCESSSSELSFLNSLTSIRRLRKLWIAFNPLNGILPTSIGNLSNSLEIIDASYCEIRGSIPSEIANLSNLISLVMDGNELTGLIPTTIKSLKKLQVLNLYDNRIQGFIPVNLCYLKNLGDLQLGKNNLSGLIPACLGNITSLRYLDLDSNKLISSIPTSLWSLKDLLKLNLSSNYLSGYLPLELGNLKVAIRIDLSMNQFSGQIPNTIGGLQGVMNLSLAHNRLQGPIPQSIGSLVDLEFCDLSHNNLSGVIPMSLEELLQLRYFNVSFNRLRGEIPSRGSFANFTYQSFMSNEALCGAPRLQVPPCHADSHRQSRIKQMLLIVYFLLPIASVLLAITFVFAFIRCRQRRNQNPIQTDLLPARIRHGRITYHELSRATDMFSESNLLGAGSFSSVYKGMFPGKMIFAIKVFKLELDGAFKSFETECEILRNIRHRNLTKVISSCSTLDFKALVLEYMPNGTLEKWLYSHNYFLDMLQRMDIMIDVACAFEYLHHGYSVPVAHCNLKPSNVLLDDDMVAHVSDFGIAKLLGVGESIAQTRTIATFGYIAPEYGLEGLVSTKCDVYSYGIMLMETFTRTKPTDARFDGGLSLKYWVVDALPNAIVQVLDANLLRQDIEHNNAKVQCVSSLMQLALNCSEDSPEERMIMKDVLVSIKKIRLRYVENCQGLLILFLLCSLGCYL